MMNKLWLKDLNFLDDPKYLYSDTPLRFIIINPHMFSFCLICSALVADLVTSVAQPGSAMRLNFA